MLVTNGFTNHLHWGCIGYDLQNFVSILDFLVVCYLGFNYLIVFEFAWGILETIEIQNVPDYGTIKKVKKF